MAIPTLDVASSTSVITAYGTQVDVPINGAVLSGNTILLVVCCDGSYTFNTPTGYTALTPYGYTNHVSVALFTKVSDGTETHALVSLVTGNSRIEGQAHIIVSASGAPGQATSNGFNQTTQTAPDISATTDALVLRIANISWGSDVPFVTSPSTLVEVTSSGANSSHVTTSTRKTTKSGPGAVGTASWTTGTAVVWAAATLLFYGSGGVASSSITSVTDPWVNNTGNITISGTGFEAAIGAGTITVPTIAGNQHYESFVVSWSDTQIVFGAGDIYGFGVGFGASTITVTPDSNSASSHAVNITPQSDEGYVTLTSVNSTAAYRISSVADLEVGDQIAYKKFLFIGGSASTHQGEVHTDGSITFDGDTPAGTYEFDARVREHTGGIWGGFIGQTIVIGTDADPPILTPPTPITIHYSLGAPGISHSNSTLITWIATAQSVDAVDGNLSSSITNTLSSLIDPLTTGSYIITFSSTDAHANRAQRTSTLTIVQDGDTAAPVVTPPSGLSLSYPSGSGGVTHANSTLAAWLSSAQSVDAVDGNLSSSITTNISGFADPFVAGSYTIVFSSRDNAGNVGTASAVFTVVQTGFPVLLVPIDLMLSYLVTETGILHTNTVLLSWLNSATANDAVDGSIAPTNNLALLASPIAEGVYTITWSATNSAGNTSTLNGTLTVTISNTQPPPPPPPPTDTSTLSGDVSFYETRDQLIEDAYKHLGVLQDGEDLSQDRIKFAARQLNKMIMAFVNKGYHLWTIYRDEITLIPGQQSYSVGIGGNKNIPRIRRVLAATRKTSSLIEVPLIIQAGMEYFKLPNKSQPGSPTQVFYDAQFTGSAILAKGYIYLWPVPDAGTTDKLEILYEGYIQKFNASTDALAMPPEWAEAVSWNLALRLGSTENVDQMTFNRVQALSATFLSDALSSDNEDTVTVQFGIDTTGDEY